jgi:hypothetical protein
MDNEVATQQRNRKTFPLDELAKYDGQHIAWAPDCSRILLSNPDLGKLYEELDRQGIKRSRMIFSLHATKFKRPLPFAGQLAYRDMPILPLRVMYGGASEPGQAYVDTMADLTLLPDRVAGQLQLDLTRAPSHTISALGGQITVRYAEVEMELRGTTSRCRWRAWVAFGPTPRWLFGHVGGLEYFHFTLDPVNEEFMLVPRDHIPLVP